ncbi:MAG: hypothetical protein ACYDFU_08145, partial [Nitrospirota bacterium]
NIINNNTITLLSGEILSRPLLATVNDPKIIISVTDTGNGIPAGEQKAIFKRYYRSEKDRKN